MAPRTPSIASRASARGRARVVVRSERGTRASSPTRIRRRARDASTIRRRRRVGRAERAPVVAAAVAPPRANAAARAHVHDRRRPRRRARAPRRRGATRARGDSRGRGALEVEFRSGAILGRARRARRPAMRRVVARARAAREPDRRGRDGSVEAGVDDREAARGGRRVGEPMRHGVPRSRVHREGASRPVDDSMRARRRRRERRRRLVFQGRYRALRIPRGGSHRAALHPRRADAREARDVRAVPRRRARSAVRDEDAMRRVSDARPVRGARREREPSQPRDANRRDDRADVPVLRNAAAARPASGRRRRRRREDETYKHNRGAPSRRGDVSSRASVRARRRRAARGSAPRAAARLCRRGVHRECLGPDLAPMPQRRDGAAVDPSRGWRRRREGGGARARRIRRRRARRRSVRARIFASSGRAAERAATSGARVVDGRRRLGAVRSFAFR